MGAVKSKVRFTPQLFSQEQWMRVGTKFRDSIVNRITEGQNVHDEDAKPLKGDVKSDKYIPYADQKIKEGLKGIRDLVRSGKTTRAIQVTRVTNNGGVISANNPIADRIIHKNNQIEPMFGVSPKDRLVLEQAVSEEIRQHPLFKIEQS